MTSISVQERQILLSELSKEKLEHSSTLKDLDDRKMEVELLTQQIAILNSYIEELSKSQQQISTKAESDAITIQRLNHQIESDMELYMKEIEQLQENLTSSMQLLSQKEQEIQNLAFVQQSHEEIVEENRALKIQLEESNFLQSLSRISLESPIFHFKRFDRS